MKKKLLDRIDIKTPCNESWDEMTGNEEVRFCSHCSKDVYDLSAISRLKAEKLVRDSNGRLCVRYVKDTRGKVVTAPTRLAQIKRQATVAASVLAASLTFSSLTYAQGKPAPVSSPNKEATDKPRQEGQPQKDPISISGVVVDQVGAIIPGAKVFLRNIKGERRGSETTDGNGAFHFTNMEPGDHEIEITCPGFRRMVITNLRAFGDMKLETPITLEVSDVSVELMGVVAVPEDSFVYSDSPQVTTEIQNRPLTPIPTDKTKKKKNNLPK